MQNFGGGHSELPERLQGRTFQEVGDLDQVIGFHLKGTAAQLLRRDSVGRCRGRGRGIFHEDENTQIMNHSNNTESNSVDNTQTTNRDSVQGKKNKPNVRVSVRVRLNRDSVFTHTRTATAKVRTGATPAWTGREKY